MSGLSARKRKLESYRLDVPLFYLSLSMRFLTLFLLLPLFVRGDDTAAIQAMLNAGNTTLTSGHTYSVTSLNIPHSLNLNNSTILFTGTSTMLKITASVTISGGTIIGSSDNTSSNQSAISINGVSNVTVNSMTIREFGQYAIIIGNGSNIHITNNLISDIGYLGISLITNSGTNTGDQITGNVIDRSMQPTSVPQAALIVRNFAPGVQTGTVVSGNVVEMPINPASASAEICEIRNCLNVVVHNNVVSGGSIGFSVVGGSNNAQLSNNTYSKQSNYAIEIGDIIASKANNETITSGKIAIIFDGSSICQQDTISNTTISGMTSFPVQFIGSNVLDDVLANLTVNTVTFAVLVQNGAHGIVFNGGAYVGNNTSAAIWCSNAPGGLTFNGPISFTNFTPKLVFANATVLTTVNNITGNLVSPTGSFLGVQVGSNVTLGSNILFTNGVAPTLSYSPSTMSYAQFVLISPISPTTTGSPTSFSISPGLPASLLFNTASGQITGTPLLPQGSTSYVVSAKNSYGTGTTGISIAVSASGSSVIRVSGLTVILK